ncbi:MAG: carbohydrate ABC transporter substrate-binding protein [Caldilineaceae bacterium]|nr:carbohydrate ABC transporter substrate-binding protein [Caldilineaceae bacterium]
MLVFAACGGGASNAPAGNEAATEAPTEAAAPAEEEAPAAEEAATEAPADGSADAAATEAPAEEAAADASSGASGDAVELRMTWYDDGAEGAVMRDLLDRFEADNPDITVIMDTVPYATGILETLPIQLAAGEGPDMVRVTDLGGLSPFFLDLTPYLEDPAYWEENFGPFLTWLRQAGDESSIPGFMTQLTVTGPYVNKTLFDQAGIELPAGDATWEEWAEVTRQVAEATGTPFAMAMDRTGHRFAGPAISEGAKYFDAEGNPALDDEGFRKMAQLLIDWHADGTMIPDVWMGAGGSYAAGNEQFINAQIVMYMSGSWQIGQFNEKIGDAFDWVAVPNPCGPAACTGMPGGAALVGIADTEHPEEVARVMAYLAQPDVLGEFYGRSLFIPGHLGLAESGVEFVTDSPLTADALTVFAAEVPKLNEVAYELQGYRFNRAIFNATSDRLTQVLVGELTLDEAMTRIQEDVDKAIAEAQ